MRLLQPFVLAVTLILGTGYAYVSSRLTANLWERMVLLVPFVLVWLVPVVYWARDRDRESTLIELAQYVSYLSMAWLSFLLVLTLLRDVLIVVTMPFENLSFAHRLAIDSGVPAVIA